MGLLDDAIRDHLDLKRRSGADPAEIERAEREALGPVRREPSSLVLDDDREPGGPSAPGAPEDFIEPAGPTKRRGLFRRSRADAELTGLAAFEEEHEPLVRVQRLPRDEPATHDDLPEAGAGRPEPTRDLDDLPAGRADVASDGPTDAGLEREADPDLDDAAEPPRLRIEPAVEEERRGDADASAPPAPVAAPGSSAPRSAGDAGTPGTPGADDTFGDTAEYDVQSSFADEAPGGDVLEETPEFLQDTPDHDRLWFEQRPPRDFDFDG